MMESTKRNYEVVREAPGKISKVIFRSTGTKSLSGEKHRCIET